MHQLTHAGLHSVHTMLVHVCTQFAQTRLLLCRGVLSHACRGARQQMQQDGMQLVQKSLKQCATSILRLSTYLDMLVLQISFLHRYATQSVLPCASLCLPTVLTCDWRSVHALLAALMSCTGCNSCTCVGQLTAEW